MTSVGIEDSWGDRRPDPFWAVRVGTLHPMKLLKSYKLADPSWLKIETTTKQAEAMRFESEDEAAKFCGYLIVGGINDDAYSILIEPGQTP